MENKRRRRKGEKIRKMHMKSRTGAGNKKQGEGGAWILSFFQSKIFILAKDPV